MRAPHIQMKAGCPKLAIPLSISGYYYTESREVCKICFCEFLVIGLTNSSVVITEC